MSEQGAKPPWIRTRLPNPATVEEVTHLLDQNSVSTVCRQAHCPNQYECFDRKTATFMILGDRCSRQCRYCAVAYGPVNPPDVDEPQRVADTALTLGLRYVVVTSVTRDDLPDGGAAAFAHTIACLKKTIKGVQVEVLTPDFNGNLEPLTTVLTAKPDVFNHNLETVKRLFPAARPQGDYDRSLAVLAVCKRLHESLPTKSGLMLGLGETDTEIEQALHDLRSVGCSLLTLGQYLQPSPDHLPVERYVPPADFERWRHRALSLGFTQVASGPLVRSSYQAEKVRSGEIVGSASP